MAGPYIVSGDPLSLVRTTCARRVQHGQDKQRRLEDLLPRSQVSGRTLSHLLEEEPEEVSKSFPPSILKVIDGTKYFYLRAGDEHRFTPVWVVVVDGRVFVRPWNDKKTGWYRAFLKDRTGGGAVLVNDKELPVRALLATSDKISDAVDAAYASKYTTKANQKYVKGFATPKRRATTLELVP